MRARRAGRDIRDVRSVSVVVVGRVDLVGGADAGGVEEGLRGRLANARGAEMAEKIFSNVE